jgi:hypothetical protein
LCYDGQGGLMSMTNMTHIDNAQDPLGS